MTIFLHTLKNIFRSKLQLFFIVLFPLAFMSLGFMDGETSLRAAVIDKDHTEFTAQLVRNLESKAKLQTVKEEDIGKKLMALEVDFVLVLDKGFTETMIRGERGGITSYTIEESNFSAPVSAYVEQWIRDALTIADAVNHKPEAFYQSFAPYTEQQTLQLDPRLAVDSTTTQTTGVLGYLLISMLYTSLITGLHILLNKNNRTFYRTLTAPVRLHNYLLQTVGSFVIVSWIQITFALAILKWVYGIYMGSGALQIYPLLLLFSLVTVSFGIAVTSFSKSVVQACLIGICLITPIALLGGAYFPMDSAPDILKTISPFSPVTWVISGLEKLVVQGQTFASLGQEVAMILVFSIIFFLIGSIRKADLAK